MVREQHQSTSRENFRNKISSIDSKGKRVFIFPKRIIGRFYKYRTKASWILVGILFILPFIKYNDRPLFLFNILERKFIVFGQIFWAQDFFIFLLAVIALILFIILFTVVFGRVFCGWACPQTIFMEMVFRKIEYWIDGNSVQQKKLSKAPWTGEKIRKRTLKYSIFFLLSLLIGNLFMSYIVGLNETLDIVSNSPRQNWIGFLVVISFSGITFFNFAYFREQVCTVVCPYGRLQGVLLDKKSMVVAYDHKRGEPREMPKRTRSESAGDCIDCFACVDVCPTGIDIRNGTQLECVNCTACIDACDSIMDKIKKPRGLIRIDSEESIETGVKKSNKSRIFAYSIALLLLTVAFAGVLLSQKEINFHIIKSRGTLYSVSDEGLVKNVFNVTLTNKTFSAKEVSFKVDPSMEANLTNVSNLTSIEQESTADGIVIIEIPKAKLLTKSTKIDVSLYSGDQLIDVQSINFLKP